MIIMPTPAAAPPRSSAIRGQLRFVLRPHINWLDLLPRISPLDLLRGSSIMLRADFLCMSFALAFAVTVRAWCARSATVATNGASAVTAASHPSVAVCLTLASAGEAYARAVSIRGPTAA
jgi:hypothetical protein